MNDIDEPPVTQPNPPRRNGPPPPPAQRERLLRRVRDGQMGGVAEGLAKYLAVDVAIVRIAFVAATIFGGIGAIVYLAGWVLIPLEGDSSHRPIRATGNTFAMIIGGGILLAGGIVLLATTDFFLDDSLLVGVGLFALGWWILNQREDEETLQARSQVPPPASTITGTEPSASALADAAGEFWVADAVLADAGMASDPELAGSVQDDTSLLPPTAGSEVEYWAAPRLDTDTRVASPPAPPGPPITSTTLGIATLTIGVMLVLRTVAGLGISAVAIAAAATIIIGGGLIASAFLGRARWLWFFGFLSLSALAMSPLVDTAITGGVGDSTFKVTSIEELQDTYELGMGNLEVDLSELPAGVNRTIDVKLGAGYAEIIVPRDATVIVDAKSRFGYVEVEEKDQAGIDPRVEARLGSSDETILTINVNVTFGAVEVSRG